MLQQINVKKCPSSIWCWDSNSQPSDYESPPLTTRPIHFCFYQKMFSILTTLTSTYHLSAFIICCHIYVYIMAPATNVCTVKIESTH